MQRTRFAIGPSMWENLIVVLAALFVLEENSRLPSASFFVVIIGGTAIIGTGIVYLARIAIHYAEPKASNSEYLTRRNIAKWAVLPAALALLLSSDATHWPATLRFHFSKSSFERLIAQAHQGVRPAGFPRWVGLYWVEALYDDSFDYRAGKGELGFVTGTALIDPCGINYDPADPSASHGLTTRIAQCWYLTEW